MRNSIISSMAGAGVARDRSPARAPDDRPIGGGASLAGLLPQSPDFEGEDGDARSSRAGSVPTRKDGSEVGIAADIGIRAIGLFAITLSAAIFRWLYADIHHHVATQASIGQLVFAAVAFLSASFGCGLLTLGRHIHDRIEVAERWRPRL